MSTPNPEHSDEGRSIDQPASEEEGQKIAEDFLDRTINTADGARGGGPESMWDRDDAVEGLKMERTVHTDESPEEMTKRMIEEAGPLAAASIIHLALHSQNDNTRFNASKYIADKLYGDESGKSGKSPWEELMADVVSSAELIANSHSRGASGGSGK